MPIQTTFGGLLEPYATGVGVGKWDRFMTYGRKVQDGIPFDFTPDTFAQIVDNFARNFSMRRLGLDGRHDAAHPEKPGPEQNLAYYSGLAVILDGKVIKLWDHFPDRLPPDPVKLLAELQQKFPRIQTIEDVGGLWGYKSEVTPLGEQTLPNCEQLSPLFSQDDRDESGNPIGYNLLNVSAVGVAFQNGTLINLSKPLLNAPQATFDKTRTQTPAKAFNKALALSNKALSRKKTMNDTLSPELMTKLMKHGLAAEHEPEALKKAFTAYMAETEDGPSDRKAMAEEYAKCMSKMDDTDPDGSQAQMDDTDPDGSQAKMDKSDKEPDGDEGKDEDKEDKKAQMSKLASAQTKQVAQMSKELHEVKEQFRKLEREKIEAEKTGKAIAFARQAVIDGRWRAENESDLVGLAKAGHGELAIKPFSKGTFTYMQKWTSGGGPQGRNQAASSTAESGAASYLGRNLARGVSFSAMTKRRAEEKKISLAAAQLEIYKEHPELYIERN